jgi:nucleoside 2-deoxyribosyltransferase
LIGREPDSELFSQKDNVMTHARSIFVGGPIQHAINGSGFDTTLRDLFHIVHDVLERAGFGVLSAHRAEQFGLTTAELSSDEIAVRDHAWMEQCIAFMAVIPLHEDALPYRTDGTHIELGWASGQKKPIILVATQPLARGYSQVIHGLRKITSVHVLDSEMVRKNPTVLIWAVERALAPAVTANHDEAQT